MKKGAWPFLVAGVLCMTLLVASCSGGGDGNTGTKDTSTTGGTSTTNGGGEQMKAQGGVIKEHTKAEITANSNCLSCHDKVDGKYKHIRMPVPETYHSFVQNKNFSVVAGTDQDHTGVTNTQCFDTPNCHQMPTT